MSETTGRCIWVKPEFEDYARQFVACWYLENSDMTVAEGLEAARIYPTWALLSLVDSIHLGRMEGLIEDFHAAQTEDAAFVRRTSALRFHWEGIKMRFLRTKHL